MGDDVDLTVFGRVYAVADDLSGAAETAMALTVRGTRSVVRLSGVDGVAEVVVVDLDTRSRPAPVAAAAVTRTLAEVPPGYRIFKKIDSLLRGNVAAEVGAVADAGYGVVMTPALPVAGRTVRGGVLHVDGRPLHEGAAWRAEHAAPPKSIAAALAPTRVQVVGLDVVRSGDALADLFTAANGRILVCDAETDEDLDAVALAAARVPEGLALAGSGGLAAAVGRLRTGTDLILDVQAGARDLSTPVLVVVGTADPVAVAQVERLRGFAVHSLDPEELAAGAVALPAIVGPTVIRVDPAAPVLPGRARSVAAGLAATVVAARCGPVALVLVGGETGRRVLDALGVDALEPVGAVHHGAVLSRVPGGGTVVTRPGSFGGPDSLVQIVRHLEGTTP